VDFLDRSGHAAYIAPHDHDRCNNPVSPPPRSRGMGERLRVS
jgi:hypothetical protein